MKEIISVRKRSLGVASQFMLPVGESAISTLHGCLAYLQPLLKCSKVVVGSDNKPILFQFHFHVQNRV